MGGRGGAPRTNLNTAVAQAAARAQATPSAETQIREAHDRLSRYAGDWVPLADIRLELSGLSREQQDTALRSLDNQPGVHIIHWDNTKALRPRDHEAAIRLGGQDNHVIRIDRV